MCRSWMRDLSTLARASARKSACFWLSPSRQTRSLGRTTASSSALAFSAETSLPVAYLLAACSRLCRSPRCFRHCDTRVSVEPAQLQECGFKAPRVADHVALEYTVSTFQAACSIPRAKSHVVSIHRPLDCGRGYGHHRDCRCGVRDIHVSSGRSPAHFSSQLGWHGLSAVRFRGDQLRTQLGVRPVCGGWLVGRRLHIHDLLASGSEPSSTTIRSLSNKLTSARSCSVRIGQTR